MARQAKRASRVSTVSVPAPIGGLNARDAIADMKATDAVIMDNWVPGPTSVSIRSGYVQWVTGFRRTRRQPHELPVRDGR
jgi:hypothetical protein